jgi:hypothetical protein
MKFSKLTFLILTSAFVSVRAASQNMMINILTQNSGTVNKGKTVFLEATINNTDPNAYLGIYKLQVKISVPSEIVTIPATGHVLPTGWTITSNTGSTITLSNGKNMIASNDSRTILIAVQGKQMGGPSTISGQLLFSNGEAPGTAPGSLSGENPADNTSTTTIKVLR